MFTTTRILPECKLLVVGLNQTGKTALIAKLVNDMFKSGNYCEITLLCDDYSPEIYKTVLTSSEATSYHTDSTTFCEVLQTVILRQQKRVRPRDSDESPPAIIRTITVVDIEEDELTLDRKGVIKRIAQYGRNWRMLFVMSASPNVVLKSGIARCIDGFFFTKNSNKRTVEKLWELYRLRDTISLPLFTSMLGILEKDLALFVNVRKLEWFVFNFG
jgi:hypothetical protein